MTRFKSNLIVLIGLVYSLSCFAQTSDSGYWPKKSISIGFVNSTIEQDNTASLKSNYGISFSVGRTFYLHKPISNCLRFAIDATWLDLTYTNYKIEHITYWGSNKFDINKAEIGMQVGPSIVINPISKMVIHAYFRYTPSFSCLISDGKYQGHYASYIVGGTSISYRAIGLGIEWRHGYS